MKSGLHKTLRMGLGPFLLLLLALHLGGAMAAATDISNVPLVGANAVPIKPNIMLLLDTSNSMSWTHMPDQMESVGAKQSIGYKSNKCNALYYDTNTVYTLPKDLANASAPVPLFVAAPYSYYTDSASNVDLSSSFQAHDDNTVQYVGSSVADTPQKAYYFSFTAGSSKANAQTILDAVCSAADTTAANSTTTVTVPSNMGTWKRVLVTSTSGPGKTDERPNFAIWYTYYRTRINLAKSAIGTAFASPSLFNTIRAGFLTVNPTLSSTGKVGTDVLAEHYTPIADFGSTQHTLWYSNFYGQVPAGSSPAREALARVGRHYAGQVGGINSGMPQDPIQQACQPNFTIMTTDGYWNVNAEKAGLGGGPTTIDGKSWVGMQDNIFTPAPDGLVPLGVYDGSDALLGYSLRTDTTTTTTYPACTLANVEGYTTTTATQTKSPQTQTTKITPVNNVTTYQSRVVSYSKTTYTETKTVTTYWKAGTTSQKTEQYYTLYNPATEQSPVVAFCDTVASSNCILNSTVTTVALGSCTDQLPNANNFYHTISCVGAGQQPQTASCVDTVNGCIVTSTVTKSLAANKCSSGTTKNPTYTVTTCDTVTVDTVSPTNACSASTSSNPSVSCGATIVVSDWTTIPSACSNKTLTSTTALECQTLTSCSGTCPAASSTTIDLLTALCAPSSQTLGNTKTTITCGVGAVVETTVADPANCSSTAIKPSSANGYYQIDCVKTTTPPVPGTCFPQTAALTNGWVGIACSTASGTGWRTQTIESYKVVKETVGGNKTPVLPSPPNGSAKFPDSCKPNPSPTPANPVPVTVSSWGQPVATTMGGSTNSLADVAQYYYATDLRPDMANIVKVAKTGLLDDRATWQHMTTFVVGLGVSGVLPYQSDYATATTGSFASIKSGAAGWPVWPDPTINYTNNDIAYNAPQSIDDFWHAAVDGRGQYFSAAKPQSVVDSITAALASASATAGAGTGLVISDQVGKTINGLDYTSGYISSDWTGDLISVPSTSDTLFWSAKAKLLTQVGLDCDDRKIYVRSSSGTTHLAEFTVKTKKCSDGSVSTALSNALQAKISATGLSQYGSMSTGTSGQQSQADVASLVNYIRGQNQNEGFVAGTSGKLYRTRKAILGDLINSKPQYVGAPYYGYLDSGYSSFRSDQAARAPLIYVGGNDGMLHAFNAPDAAATGTTLANAGTEAWAYIPTQVVGNLAKLADVNYGTSHLYFVDGTPTTADVQFSDSTWHTILVGGLNDGGRGYYALDITDPANPSSLWEFDSSNCSPTGCNVGLSYGQPVVGKMADGTWAVFLTSGYNNTTGSAGGQAALFVLNAETGGSIRTMKAGTTSVSSPLGLTQISAWTNYPNLDNTVQRVYGGDQYGDMWRFDVNSFDVNGTPLSAAYLLGVAKDSSGAIQPITTAPELAMVKGQVYVYFGTGSLLGVTDQKRTQTESVYGIHDTLASADNTTNLRSVLNPFVTTTTNFSTTCAPNANCNVINASGFVVDLSGAAEQVLLTPTLVNSTLTIVTNLPNDPTLGACGSGGNSNVYYINAADGTSMGDGKALGVSAVGLTYVNSGDGLAYLYARGAGGRGGSAGDWGVDATGSSGGSTYSIPSGDAAKTLVPNGSATASGVSRTSWRAIHQ